MSDARARKGLNVAITPLASEPQAQALDVRADTSLADFAVLIDFAETTAVVSVRGDLDAHTAPTLGGLLGSLVDDGHHRITLDLAPLTFIGAGGLGVIAGTAGRLRQLGGALTLRGPRAQARRILDLTGISQRVAIEHGPVPGLRADLARAAWRPTASDLVDDKLRQLVSLASAAVVGADGVSVSLARHGRISTVAASNDTVMRMDDHQYATHQGPCLSAAAEGLRFDIASLPDEDRWPAFVPLAIAEGIASILSTPLMADDGPIGALNIYSNTAGAFGQHQRELAVVFATHASQIADGTNAELTDEQLDARIADALQSRTVLALAQGILMARNRVTADEASAVLHRSARDAGTSALLQATGVVASTDVGPLEVLGHG